MYRIFFHSVIMVFAFNANAFVIPQKPSDVSFVNANKDLQFKDIPQISKKFSPAKNKTEREVIKKECQDWAIQQTQVINAPIFRIWCQYETDVVLRQYNITGRHLIKNW